MERRYELTVDGHRVVMGALSARAFLRIAKGELGAAEQLELIAAGCLEHDLDGDLLDAPLDFVERIGLAWIEAVQEQALPPRSGRR